MQGKITSAANHAHGAQSLKNWQKKVVFYHNQDYYDFKQGHTFYLAWAGDGEVIVSVLQKWGLKVNWGGAENQRIGIAPSSAKKTKSTERQAYKSNTRQL